MTGTLAGSLATKDLSAGTGYFDGASLGTDIEVDGAVMGFFSIRSIFYLASARGDKTFLSASGALGSAIFKSFFSVFGGALMGASTGTLIYP